MIDDIDSHDVSGVHHPRGQHEIVVAGRRVAGWMIVEKNDRRRRGGCGFSKDFARMNDGPIERSNRHDLHANQPVLRVEHDDPELLHRLRRILRDEMLSDAARTSEQSPFGDVPRQGTASELDGRKHLRRACASDAGYGLEISVAGAGETLEPTRAFEQPIGELQRVELTGTAAEDDRDQLVVAERRDAETFQLLAGAIVWSNVFHSIYTRFLMRRTWMPSGLAIGLLVAACAAPPNKEIDQAQGAIDAARAAGADRYATTEYNAAATALMEANEAVVQRDYRLALNRALESREQAQNAARTAATTRGRLRGEVERSMAEVAALMAQANSKLAAAEKARLPRRVLRPAQQALAQVNADVQKVGAAMQAEDYGTAQPALAGVKKQIAEAIATLDTANPSQSPRRRQ